MQSRMEMSKNVNNDVSMNPPIKYILKMLLKTHHESLFIPVESEWT